MNDNNLDEKIEQINDNVSRINRRIGGSAMAVWRGMLSGFGYIIGASIAILIIGWILNVVGVIPTFKQQVESLKTTIKQAQQRQIPGAK